MEKLGTLRRIDAREVWKHEAHDFTPWLKGNIELLGSALGLDLDLVEAEVPVGPFAADLVAKDVGSDRWVVIENQLSPTDHGHLGQLLTYGAGKEAGVFVWISPEFRDEHRAALDWLNEHSDEDSSFFGVVIELIAVDDSPPAANLRLISFPNEWTKGTRSTRNALTEKGAAYMKFFQHLLDEFKSKHPGQTSASKVYPESWLAIGAGKSGLWNSWGFTVEKRFRVELSIDAGTDAETADYFEQLRAQSEEIESLMGHALDWEQVEGRRTCRIYSYYNQSPVSVLDDDDLLASIRSWAVDEMKTLRDAFERHIQQLKVN